VEVGWGKGAGIHQSLGCDGVAAHVIFDQGRGLITSQRTAEYVLRILRSFSRSAITALQSLVLSNRALLQIEPLRSTVCGGKAREVLTVLGIYCVKRGPNWASETHRMGQAL
jgi:hypothetical protein